MKNLSNVAEMMMRRAERKTEEARRSLETARMKNDWAREEFWREMLGVRIKQERKLRVSA